MSDPIPTPADIAPPALALDAEKFVDGLGAAKNAPGPVATAPEAAPTARTLEDVLGAIEGSDREVVLEALSKRNREAKNLRDRVKDLEPRAAEYEKVLDSQKTAEQKALEAATAAESRAQALMDRATRAEIKALAVEGFADPEDAVAALDSSKYVTDDGDVDTESIKSDLADILSRKPHWAKVPESRIPAPNPAQGTSGGGATPNIDAQIAEAEKVGNYAQSIALKQQRASLNTK